MEGLHLYKLPALKVSSSWNELTDLSTKQSSALLGTAEYSFLLLWTSGLRVVSSISRDNYPVYHWSRREHNCKFEVSRVSTECVYLLHHDRSVRRIVNGAILNLGLPVLSYAFVNLDFAAVSQSNT
jgi:hypothetical protein